MDIEMRKGVCRFCGQIGIVEAPDISQDQIDEMITRKCICGDSAALREEEDRKQRIRMYVETAKKGIKTLFEDWPEAKRLLTEMAEPVATGTIVSISIKMEESDTRASISRKADGSLKITRKDSTTKSIG